MRPRPAGPNNRPKSDGWAAGYGGSRQFVPSPNWPLARTAERSSGLRLSFARSCNRVRPNPGSTDNPKRDRHALPTGAFVSLRQQTKALGQRVIVPRAEAPSRAGQPACARAPVFKEGLRASAPVPQPVGRGEAQRRGTRPAKRRGLSFASRAWRHTVGPASPRTLWYLHSIVAHSLFVRPRPAGPNYCLQSDRWAAVYGGSRQRIPSLNWSSKNCRAFVGLAFVVREVVQSRAAPPQPNPGAQTRLARPAFGRLFASRRQQGSSRRSGPRAQAIQTVVSRLLKSGLRASAPVPQPVGRGEAQRRGTRPARR